MLLVHAIKRYCPFPSKSCLRVRSSMKAEPISQPHMGTCVWSVQQKHHVPCSEWPGPCFSDGAKFSDIYLPRSEGGNVCSSTCPSVCVCVCLSSPVWRVVIMSWHHIVTWEEKEWDPVRGVPNSRPPSKFDPFLPAPWIIFLMLPKIYFFCSPNKIWYLPAPLTMAKIFYL